MNNYNGILNTTTSTSAFGGNYINNTTTAGTGIFGTITIGNCGTTTGTQLINNSNSTVTISSPLGGTGFYGNYNGNTAIGYSALSFQQDQDTAEFCELVLAALGHEIKYDEFKYMSKQDRKALLRDVKISRILG
jgi:hypothetical protein